MTVLGDVNAPLFPTRLSRVADASLICIKAPGLRTYILRNLRRYYESRKMKLNRKFVIAAALLLVAGCGDIRSRSDFETVVKGLSPAEVQAKVGKPAAVDESAAETVRWTYNKANFSNESGGTQFDKKTVVVFRKANATAPGSVTEVVYE